MKKIYNSYIEINNEIVKDLEIYKYSLQDTCSLAKEKAREFLEDNKEKYKEISYVLVSGHKNKEGIFLKEKVIFSKYLY